VTNADVADVIHELELSPNAQIFFRGAEGYANLTKRWQYWNAPDVDAVVEVATAKDVAETVSRRPGSFDSIIFMTSQQLHSAAVTESSKEGTGWAVTKYYPWMSCLRMARLSLSQAPLIQTCFGQCRVQGIISGS
jgi:hypothetical protein